MLQPFLLDSTSSKDIQLVASCDTDGTTKVMGAESCSPLAEASPRGLGECSDICAHPRPARDASDGAIGSAFGGSASGRPACAPSSATLDLCRPLEAATTSGAAESSCPCSAQGCGGEHWSPATQKREPSD